MARIVTVYLGTRRLPRMVDMSMIRWWRMSTALAGHGHDVDIATNEWRWVLGRRPRPICPGLRVVPLSGIDWSRYDVVKTLFHLGFSTLRRHGGHDHPFVISKLGSVVANDDREGILFHGEVRRRLYAIQQEIASASRYVTVLSRPAETLWVEAFGDAGRLLLVPGAVDAHIPPPGPSPFGAIGGKICLFSGNIYDERTQPQANAVLCDKLNRLGRLLARKGMRVVFQGGGDTHRIDRTAVICVAPCDYERSWDSLHHADVGVVVTGGGRMHNNESTKIYHYLRAGLPTVVEEGFPNDDVVRESGLGFVVPNGDIEALSRQVLAAASHPWNRAAAVDYVLRRHTWDVRASVYDGVIRRHLAQ